MRQDDASSRAAQGAIRYVDDVLLVTKLACEHLIDVYIRDFGLRCTALRYFTVYGPRQRPDMAFQRIVEALAAGSEFEVYGDGSQSRDFTFVADAVAATIASDGPRP